MNKPTFWRVHWQNEHGDKGHADYSQRAEARTVARAKRDAGYFVRIQPIGRG
jgi:hypothetical protein